MTEANAAASAASGASLSADPISAIANAVGSIVSVVGGIVLTDKAKKEAARNHLRDTLPTESIYERFDDAENKTTQYAIFGLLALIAIVVIAIAVKQTKK